MKRVLVLGNAGSGKSSFAEKLAEKLGIPCIHLDSHFWNPDWTPTPKEEWPDVVRRLIDGDEWVMDGNYSNTLDERMQRADTAIYLRVRRPVAIWRIIKRRIANHGKVRAELPEGCYEKIDLDFLRWIWNHPKRAKSGTFPVLERYSSSEKTVLFLDSREAQECLDSLA
ncbi:MAG: AAA family ATPase [Candidatus Thorarchaeota archaeon]|jgi:adenylate kinase family enzyme